MLFLYLYLLNLYNFLKVLNLFFFFFPYFIGLEEVQDEFFGNAFSRALGYDTQVIYAFDGVSIAVSYSLINHFAVDTGDLSVFDFVFDRIRLDISGSGLDNFEFIQ